MAGHSSNIKVSKLAELEVPPSVLKAAPLAVSGDPRVPVGGERQCWRPKGNQGSQASSAL